MRRLVFRRVAGSDGFTLIEIMVALVIVGLISAALVPVLIVTAKASSFASLNTVAKNLAQQRIESMRNLPFYVAYQNTGPNGQFYDVLDDYYANVSTSTVTFPSGATGTWVQSGTGANGTPTGPYYQVTFNSIPGSPGFSQVVYTQFLTAAQPVPAPVSATLLANYNSAVAGQDSPPSLLLGVTVVTSWRWNGASHKDSTFTEIAANGNNDTLIASQAHLTALSVASTDSAGNQLTGTVGQVQLNGSVANTSSASAQALAAALNQSNGASLTGASGTVVSPPNASLSVPPGSQGTVGGYSPCGWGAMGPTQLTNLSSTTAGGLPAAPSNVGSGSTPAAVVEADLKANNGGSCAGFRFSNNATGAAEADPTLQLSSTAPMVQVVDATGNGPEVSAKGAINALNSPGASGAVYASTEVDFATGVAVFPGLPFVPTGSMTCGSGTQACGSGLVNVFLTKATMSCQSNASTAAVASYAGYLTYWVQPTSSSPSGWHTVPLSWSSASGPATDPLAAVNLAQTVTTYNGSPVPLSAYINSWSTGRTITQGSSGESTIPSVVAITTANTRYGDSSSAIGLQLGTLSCQAVDNR